VPHPEALASVFGSPFAADWLKRVVACSIYSPLPLLLGNSLTRVKQSTCRANKSKNLRACQTHANCCTATILAVASLTAKQTLKRWGRGIDDRTSFLRNETIMIRPIALVAAIAVTLCLSVSTASAQRGKGGGRNEGGKAGGRSEPKHEQQGKSPAAHGHSAPGGNWSEPTHQSGRGANQSGGHAGAAAGAAKHNSSPQASGAQGAAAGAAAAKRNSPQASGAQGAAAGAAAANRNAPKATGAQGAAAGAAAANRNQPQVSGAAGAAAGAAAANRNQPELSGAAGAAVGAAAANRNQPQVSGAAGAAVGAAAVRSSYNNPHLYDEQWYGAHAGVWTAGGLTAAAVWAPTTWNDVSSYCGAAATPIAYNYGNNVTCQDGNVSVDGQNVGTAAEYSQQAADLATAGAAAEDSSTDEWLPLGVFAMVRNEQQHPQLILQMAINKQGILRGNYTDELTEHTQPIQGSVDPKTQRAAWTVGDNKTSIMEAGLSNLAQGEAPALIHKKGKTDHWLLVRLDQPAQDAGAPADPTTQPSP
jgi:hypothetical protein